MARIFKTPFGAQGDTEQVPEAPQGDGSVSLTQGFGYDYEREYEDPEAKDIRREVMNGLFHDITEAIGDIQLTGIAKWDAAAAPYPAGAVVWHSSVAWMSTAGNNSSEPGAGADWTEFAGDAADVLRQDLANPDKGAAMVGRGVVAVESIADLRVLPSTMRRADLKYSVSSFWGGWAVVTPFVGPMGGGEFSWSPTTPKSQHNGGTVIDPDRLAAWSGSHADLATLFEAGESGSGCFVRNDTVEVTPDMFGTIVKSSNVTRGEAEANTLAFQQMLDTTGYIPVRIPTGMRVITGTGRACLTLRYNKLLRGEGPASTIRVDNPDFGTANLDVAIQNNSGFGDVRGWGMDGVHFRRNQGGGHGVIISKGLSLINATISKCSFGGGRIEDGHYSLYVDDAMSHSTIEYCGFANIYMDCWDANVIRKCISFGRGVAITFDCPNGVRNNIVEDCTLVNRDGQVHIINGDNIRIVNNQMELAQGVTPPQNQSPTSSMIFIEGRDRQVRNTVIRDNNFGGGTSLKRSIYVDNSRNAIIDANHFVAPSEEDIFFTENSEYNRVMPSNDVRSSLLRPRVDRFIGLKITDNGKGNMGARRSPQLDNGWRGGSLYKKVDGVCEFLTPIYGGTDKHIGTVPPGFEPAALISDATEEINRISTTYISGGSWFEAGGVVEGEVSGPIDQFSAYRFTQNIGETQAARIRYTISFVTGTPICLMVYAKPAGKDWLVIDVRGGQTWFNLQTGEVGTTSSRHDPVIGYAGNGFYACQVRFEGSAGFGNVAFAIADEDGTLDVADSGSVDFFLPDLQELNGFIEVNQYSSSLERLDVDLKPVDLGGGLRITKNGEIFVEDFASGETLDVRGRAYASYAYIEQISG